MLRDSLIATMGGALDRLAAAGGGADLSGVLARLAELRLVAVGRVMDGSDENALTSFVSAVNLMTDCVRGTVDRSAAARQVAAMDAGPRWEAAFRGMARLGARLSLPRDEAPAFTVMTFGTFVDVFMEPFGDSSADHQEKEALWRDLRAGLQIPIEDAGLVDPARSTWISDDRKNGGLFRSGDLERDVYDALGLDWSGRKGEGWEEDRKRFRVVLLSCPLHERHLGAGSVHCTTTFDGWNSLLYVPRRPTGEAWPEHGSATAGPASDLPQMPEAVHGPAPPKSGRYLWAEGIGLVEVGDRAKECGDAVSQRAMSRLEAAVGALPEVR